MIDLDFELCEANNLKVAVLLPEEWGQRWTELTFTNSSEDEGYLGKLTLLGGLGHD